MYQAIAAMSLNRVIGRQGQIPWYLPDDFRWFKQKTTGHVLVMGRKTYESIGKPLPNRTTFVLSRNPIQIPGVQVIPRLDDLPEFPPEKIVFICGGAEIYNLALPLCSDLFLTLVKRVIEDGDTFFPEFEKDFDLAGKMQQGEAFDILHYRRRSR